MPVLPPIWSQQKHNHHNEGGESWISYQESSDNLRFRLGQRRKLESHAKRVARCVRTCTLRQTQGRLFILSLAGRGDRRLHPDSSLRFCSASTS